MRRPQLTDDEKLEIIKEVRDNNRTIAYVAKEFDRSRKTIYNLVRKHSEGGSTDRVSKLSSKEKIRICGFLTENPSVPISELRDKLGLGVSCSTIQRYIQEQGFVRENSKAHPHRVRV